MSWRKGYHLSINAIITLVFMVVLIALVMSISTGILDQGKAQIISIGGL